MCTAVSFSTKDHYFGRNLDLEYTYDEAVVITPRNYAFHFCNGTCLQNHYAMIGMATVADHYPLYYEATNEYGLSMAALNFPGNAKYMQPCIEKDNISPFEFIPWILCQRKTVHEAVPLLERLNLIERPFNKEYSLTPLHWLLADRNTSLVIEPCTDGVRIHKNPVGILANNPPFEYHIQNLSNYMNLTSAEPTNRFSNEISILPYSRGMGAIGLPGDLSSASRFIRAAFTKFNSVCCGDENESVSQFFHILDSVSQTRGCARVGDNYEITVYSSCCNTDKGVYYYTTYDNRQITAIKMFEKNLEADKLYSVSLIKTQQINYMN